MTDFITGCPKRENVKILCAGQAALKFNEWNASYVPQGMTPPSDIYVYVEWDFGGVPFRLYKYRSGFCAMWVPGSGSYMAFGEDIRRDFTIVQYFDDGYNDLISYSIGE